jgi:sugar/nucleoside kinase (ribokinase family)
MHSQKRRGLFVGLVTLDFVYLVDQPPSRNQKIAAADYTVSAGGPATNAAVAFRHLGNPATLLSLLGQHPITHLIVTDLQQCGVDIADLDSTKTEPPPVSSIMVTRSTGDRAVVSLNAMKTQATEDTISADILKDVDIILIDAHQMAVARTITTLAKIQEIPIVADCGSWKPGFETVLPYVDYAICSANFFPPNCQYESEVIKYLTNLKIPHIAITHGERPIHYLSKGESGKVEVPQVKAVDTLGAGDIFHGALCHYLLQNEFVEALTAAAKVASHSCQFFGTRHWMQ